MAVTWWSEQVRDEMQKVIELGVNSFKTFMAYKDVFMIDDAEMLECYRHTGQIGGIAMVHAENGKRTIMKTFQPSKSS